jgi:CheY-like chemotaxis protein
MEQAPQIEPRQAARPAMPDEVAPLAILAVDDDALVLTNTAAMLEDRGHRVTVAYSGREARELLRRQRFDLLITDQGMPGMTGIELIQHVRAEQPDLPIVLATAYAELPSGLAPNVPRIGKPFLQAQLLDVVTRAMAK